MVVGGLYKFPWLLRIHLMIGNFMVSSFCGQVMKILLEIYFELVI